MPKLAIKILTLSLFIVSIGAFVIFKIKSTESAESSNYYTELNIKFSKPKLVRNVTLREQKHLASLDSLELVKNLKSEKTKIDLEVPNYPSLENFNYVASSKTVLLIDRFDVLKYSSKDASAVPQGSLYADSLFKTNNSGK